MNATCQVPAHLRLICGSCTRQTGFAGIREEAEAAAKRAGWIIGERVICPKCPGIRPAMLPPLSAEQRAEIGAVAIAQGDAIPGDVLTLPQFPDEPPIIAGGAA